MNSWPRESTEILYWTISIVTVKSIKLIFPGDSYRRWIFLSAEYGATLSIEFTYHIMGHPCRTNLIFKVLITVLVWSVSHREIQHNIIIIIIEKNGIDVRRTCLSFRNCVVFARSWTNILMFITIAMCAFVFTFLCHGFTVIAFCRVSAWASSLRFYSCSHTSNKLFNLHSF